LVEKVRNVVIIPSSLNNPANLNGFWAILITI
jgi:hypothetical protein